MRGPQTVIIFQIACLFITLPTRSFVFPMPLLSCETSAVLWLGGAIAVAAKPQWCCLFILSHQVQGTSLHQALSTASKPVTPFMLTAL